MGSVPPHEGTRAPGRERSHDLDEHLLARVVARRGVYGARFDADLVDVPCTACGRPIGDTACWYADDTGRLSPYCASCAPLEAGVRTT